MTRSLIVCAAVLFFSSTVAHAQLGQLNHLSTYVSTNSAGDPLFDEGLVEIAAYDKSNKRVFLTNGNDDALTILDITNPAAPTFFGSLDLSAYGGPTSVAVSGSLIAVANEAASDVTDSGTVVFYDANDLGAAPTPVTVGPLPDMVTFTPDGSKLLIANEGEASETDPLNNNPAGSIGFINTTTFDYTEADFTSFALTPGASPISNVRINPNVNSAVEDLEPEYITVSPDGTKAFATLQENNTIAVIDVANEEITDLLPLGVKDHSLPGNGLDAAKDDDTAVIQPEPLLGMYMPDGMAAYNVGGINYIITANEGDARDEDFGTFAEYRDEDEIGGDATLDPGTYDAAFETRLDDLRISHHDGDTDDDGDLDQLFTYGGRSFSIFAEDGTLIFDSGDDFEQEILGQFPDNFNAGDDDFDLDDRSDNSGPEPEGVALGQIAGRTLAFIGIEKMGGVMVYDVTDPFNVSFLHYMNDRQFDDGLLDTFEDITDGNAVDPADRADLLAALEAGTFDIAPEGLLFIPAADSPNGEDLLLVANEVSGTTSIYTVVPEPGTIALLGLGGLTILAHRRRA